MNIGSVNSGFQAYPNYGAGQLKTQAEPVATDQATLKSDNGQGGGGTEITALAKANEMQKSIIDILV